MSEAALGPNAGQVGASTLGRDSTAYRELGYAVDSTPPNCGTMFPSGELRRVIERHIGGGTPSRSIQSYWNGEISWASVKDFEDGQIEIVTTQEAITKAGLGASASNLIPRGTPVVCTRMAVGRAALTAVPMAINQDVKALFPAQGVNPRYLLRLLHYVQRKADAASVGSTVKGIRVQDYLSIVVPQAPIEEQSLIARVLDTLDNAICKTEVIIEKLKQVNRGLLHDLLTRGVDASSELRPPQAQAPHLYKQSSLGWIPVEWSVKRVREVCRLGRGRVISQIDLANNPGTYPVYSSQTKGDGVFGFLDTYDFEGPHVTWTTDGANAGTVFYRNGRFNCTNVCGTLSALDADAEMRYVAVALAGATSRYVSRVGNDKLMNNVVAEIPMSLPPAHEQRAISFISQTLGDRIGDEEMALGKLRQLKAGLMEDLLTGRVRVTPLLESEVVAA